MNDEVRCSGVFLAALHRNVYDAVALARFRLALPLARVCFWSNHVSNRTSGFWDGQRSQDDTALLLRIRSAADQETFLRQPFNWCMAALENCAQADWFYQFDKEWE